MPCPEPTVVYFAPLSLVDEVLAATLEDELLWALVMLVESA